MEDRYGLSELYSPKRKRPVAHVIFVHGLFGHPRKTWTAKASRPENAGAIRAQGHPADESIKKSPLEDGVFWPQTLLPAIIPDAKILSFGYDADIGGFLSSASSNTIHQHAGNLLSDLADLRDKPEEHEIPLIFVVHSLGGIIVKDAINQSDSTVGTRLKTIAPATFGICFLGTPHRGSKTASLGKIAWNLTVIATNRPNLKLLQGLERNSETLDRIGSTFSQILLKHKIAIYSFREEQETRRLLFFNTMVVDADSAKIGDGKEEVGSIPANHSNMTKFAIASEAGFKRVSSQLRRWIEEIRRENVGSVHDHDDCLNSLTDQVTGARIREVHEAHEKTFRWLFDPGTVSFADWLQVPNPDKPPIYWIQGKPGSGKSTLMKFAMRDPRLLELSSPQTDACFDRRVTETTEIGSYTHIVQGAMSYPDWTVAAFFFHDRGSEMQKTLNGMLQEILVSILRQVPNLVTFVMPFFIRLNQRQGKRKPIWDLESLQSALSAIVLQREVRVRILLLLDALDEHSGDNEQLASLLKKLVDHSDNDYVGLKMCLASRSWTVFEEHFGSCPGFAIHEHTKSDIFTYVTSRLRPSSQVLQSTAEEESLTAIIQLVTDKALGVFIWVRLVVDLLVKGIRDGTPFAVLEVRARDMPQELKDLYAHTLRRIEPEYATEAYVMLQIALCSLAPLPLKSFLGSLDYNCEQLFRYGFPGDPDPQLRKSYAEESLPSQIRRLASRSGGLLEAVSMPSPESAENNEPVLIVQFIHQTVKEYVQLLQHDLGLREVLPDALEENGHVFLLRACAESQQSWVCCIKKDLFAYAKRVDDMQPEISRVGSYRDHRNLKVAPLLSQICDIKGEFDLVWWLRKRRDSFSRSLLRNRKGDSPSGWYWKTLLRLAVAANLLCFLSTYPTGVTKHLVGPGIEGIDLLHIAAVGPYISTSSKNVDRCQMIGILVSKGHPVNQESKQRFRIEFVSEFQRHEHLLDPLDDLEPLAFVLITDQEVSDRDEGTQLLMARTLLRLGANPDCRVIDDMLDIEHEVRALEYCVRYKSASCVRLLIEHGASIAVGPENRRLFESAYIRQDQEIIRALHDSGLESSLDTQSFKIESVTDALVAISGMWGALSGRSLGVFRV